MAPKTQKVLFLDIDGVLVNAHTLGLPLLPRERVNQRHHQFDQECVEILNFVLRKTGAVIVLSSSWRIGSEEYFGDLRAYIAEQGVKGTVISRTPDAFQVPNEDGEFDGHWSRRGNEIQKWLDDHPAVDKFAIIDDDSDMEHLMPYLVKTNFEEGLQKRHVDPLLVLLGT